MLDLRHVTDEFETLSGALAKRGFKDTALLSRLQQLATERRDAIVAAEERKQQRNQASEEMARTKDKASAEFVQRRETLRALSDEIKTLDEKQKIVENELQELLATVPNLPHASVPEGNDANANREVKRWGKAPEFSFTPKDHVEVGGRLGVIDFERAGRISGARFVLLKGWGARLERALLQLMLDVHSGENGYEEVWTPVIVRGSALRGTGQLPKFKKDLFRLAADTHTEDRAQGAEGANAEELYLVPTAEVPITNIHAGEIIEGDKLPIAYTGYTACFRSEAGSYGQDTRGMIRQHQFDKVELVRFCKPEEGEAELAKLLGHAESILQKLELHYRVVELCAGDLGFASQKTFDLEVWLPGQNAYREISSCSWFGDFQARRLSARYRAEPKGKPRLLHTLNGSGLAIGRTLVAILEQYQQADGSVTIPKALQRYVGGATQIPAP